MYLFLNKPVAFYIFIVELLCDNYVKRHYESRADLLKIAKSAVKAIVPEYGSALQAPECSTLPNKND